MPPPEPTDKEVESLSEGNSSDETPDNSPDKVMEENFLPKEPRYEESREIYKARAEAYPEIMRPKNLPLTKRYITFSARERHSDLRSRKFIEQQSLSLTNEKLAEVKQVVVKAGLIYTVIDSDAFQPSVVREFLANLVDAEPRDDGVSMYIRGSLVDFSPNLINSMYRVPVSGDDASWLDVNIDEVCGFLTDHKVNRWENMTSKYLTATNQVLYKHVCSNWMPTMNYTSMNQERLRFVYAMYHPHGFNFGKLVYNPILTSSEKTKMEKKRRIGFTTLIQQVLLTQHIVNLIP